MNCAYYLKRAVTFKTSGELILFEKNKEFAYNDNGGEDRGVTCFAVVDGRLESAAEA